MKNLIIFFNFVLLSQAILEDRWPSYVERCFRNDPNFNNCVMRSINVAYKNLAQGDTNLGLESIVPLHLDHLNLGINRTWKFNVTNVKIYGLESVKLIGFNMDWENKRVNMDFRYYGSVIINGDYTASGRFLADPSIGKGKLNILLVGGLYGANLTYEMYYSAVNVLGSEYGQILNSTCTRHSGFRADFTNELIKPERLPYGRANVNGHPEEALKGIDPELDKVWCEVQSSMWNALFYQFPLNVMFPQS